MTQRMNAAVIAAPNGTIEENTLPLPQPRRGEVLVRIVASGVNPLDIKIRASAAPHARHPFPAILGIDMAARVEAVGAGVERFRPGDAVYGMVGGVGGVQGTLADFAAVDADLIAHAPSAIPLREAAALPLVAITAWEGLVDRMAVRSGERLLVQGGAGGVGSLAVQLGRAFGADVFATGSANDRRHIEQIGATFVDRAMPVAEQVLRYTDDAGFDLVYDTAGGEALDASFVAVRAFGRVASCLGWGTHGLAPLSFKGASYSGVFTLVPLLTGRGRAGHGAILARVAALVDEGKVRPRLEPRRFTRADIDAAHAIVGAGQARGKIVIDMTDGE